MVKIIIIVDDKSNIFIVFFIFVVINGVNEVFNCYIWLKMLVLLWFEMEKVF